MRMFIRLLSIPLLVISWASWATLKLTLATVATTATPTSTPDEHYNVVPLTVK